MVVGCEVEGDYVARLRDNVPVALSISVDAEKYGNEFRFVNDYHGVIPAPNVRFSRAVAGGLIRIFVVTILPITEGQELLIQYGEEYWSAHAQQAAIGMPAAHRADLRSGDEEEKEGKSGSSTN